MKSQTNNQNTHPDNVGIPQFCILHFHFCILKLAMPTTAPTQKAYY